MKPQDVIKQYLLERYMMQLATVSGDQPWVCTVYFVVDENFNLYWASLPSRRHSREIADHPKVAVAVPAVFVKGKPIAGLQIEGEAYVMNDTPAIKPIAEKYAKKFGRDKQWIEDMSNLKTEHRMYMLAPSKYVLFDEVNFPQNTRHELTAL
jgi:uncharacterized protein YhbP (UPF0306 family)